MEMSNSLSLTEQLQKANDLLNRQSAELAVRVEAERRQRMVAEGLQEILSVLNSDRALDEILDFIVDLAAPLLDSDACAAVVPFIRCLTRPVRPGRCRIRPRSPSPFAYPSGRRRDRPVG